MYCVIDIGGTNTRITAFESKEKPELTAVMNFRTTGNYDEDMRHILAYMDVSMGLLQIQGIGIGVAAVLDDTKSSIVNANNIPGWNGKEIRSVFENRFRCRVAVENDAATAALGEAWKGNVEGNFMFLTWGTGIGGAFIRKTGGIFSVIFSELGHSFVEPGGRKCSCGQSGCLEAYCGGKAIAERYGKEADQLTPEEWEDVEDKFARGISSLTAAFPVHDIVIGGGIALKQPGHIEGIRNKVGSYLKIVPVPDIHPPALGEYSGLYGALQIIPS